MINSAEKSTDEIIRELKDDRGYKANLALSRRIASNDDRAVSYYMMDMGASIRAAIENKVMHRDIMAEYYEFLSEPFNDATQKPEWHKVSLYAGKDCSLKTYTSCIATRRFIKIAQKEKQEQESKTVLIDYVYYEALLNCDQPEEEADTLALNCAKQAFKQLGERDRLIVECLFIKKLTSLETYDLVADMIHPNPKDGLSGDEVKAGWSLKQRQTIVSLMKGRALQKLINIYNDIMNQEYERNK